MAKYQSMNIDRFTEGMVDEDQVSRLQFQETACVEAENVMFMPTGAVKRRDGYAALNTDTTWCSANKIVKMYSFTTTGSPGDNYSLAFAVCSDAGSAAIASVVASGVGSTVANFNTILGTGDPGSAWEPVYPTAVSVTTYGGSAVFTHWDNDDVPSVWPALSPTADLIDVAEMPSGARVAQAFGNYLFLGNILDDDTTTRRGSRIRWNRSALIDDWPVDQWIDLDGDDGDEITAMCLYKNKLLVFKKYKIWAVSWVGGSLMFQEERITTTIGCIGPNALMDDGGDLYFLGDSAAYMWQGSGEPTPISDKIQSQFNNVDIAYGKLDDVDSDPANWLVLFNVVTVGNTDKDTVFCYDSRFKNWTRWKLTDTMYSLAGIEFNATETYANRPLPYASYAGQTIGDAKSSQEIITAFGGLGIIYEYGMGNSDNGAAFTGYWLSRWFDFGLPHSNKRLMRATAFIERAGDYDLHVDMYTDWNTSSPTSQQTANLAGTVGIPMLEKRLDFTKQFRALQFKIYTDGISEPFTLHRLLVDWVPKGHTLVS